MWRMMHRIATATLTATLALAFAPATAPRAEAAAVQSYSDQTSGTISGTNTGPITFNPQLYPSQFTTPGTIVIGAFVTNPLPATATLTYNNTPFMIDLNVGATAGFQYYGVGYGYNPNTYQYQISGVLNGSIGGDGTSSMIATVTSITGSGSGLATTPPFPIADLVISPQGIAAPIGSTEGYTTFTGQVLVAGLPSPAPEPSTIAVFGLALAGWACRTRSKARARRVRV
jgi:PEP-CTERM motif